MKVSVKLKSLYLIFTTSLFLFTSSLLLAENTVIWREVNWPPFYILKGPDKGKGLYDEMITMLAKNLPEYKHVRSNMTTDRVRMEWGKGVNICHPSVIPDKYSIFSVVNSILLPHRIIVNENNLIGDNIISLDELMINSQLKGGVTPGRYKPVLNVIISKYKMREYIVKHPIYENLIKTLFEKRLDYIVEYPPIITYTAKKMGVSNSTRSIIIQESQIKPYLLVAVGCTKNDWGKDMIKKINEILKKEAEDDKFLEFRLRWYDDSSKALLRNIYKSVYFKDKL